MAKVTRHNAAKPDDAIFKEGYTIAVQPPKQKTEAKGPKNPAGNRKSGRSSVGRCFSHFVAVYLQKACAIFLLSFAKTLSTVENALRLQYDLRTRYANRVRKGRPRQDS